MKKAISLFLAVMMLGLAGCGQEAEPVKEEVKQEEVQTIDITIGNKSEEALTFLLKNNIGQDITGVMMKTAEQEEYSVNMMAEDVIFSQGQVAEVFYTPEESVSEVVTDKAVNSIYQVKFILADGSEVELSSLGIEDIDGEAELRFEDEVAFVSYKSKLVGNEVSTKEQELGAKVQREAFVSEQPAEEQIIYEQPQVVYVEPEQEAAVYSEPAPVPEAPVQGQEGCLTDVEILNP